MNMLIESIIKLILVVAVSVMCTSSLAFAVDVIDIGAGARSIGLGRAYNAVTADGYSLFANPAGLTGIASARIVSMYGEISGDVSYTMLGAVMPVNNNGVIGVGYAGSKAGDIIVTTIEANGRIGTLTTFSYGNDLFLFSYGNRYKERLNYGLTLKYIRKGSSQITGGEGSGMNADAGLTYDVDKRLRLAASLKNLLPGDMGAIKWGNGYVEQQPIEYKVGLLFKPTLNTNLLVDVNTKSGYPSDAKAGLEWLLNKHLALRFGAEQLAASSYARYVNYSAGVGIAVANINFDYAYYYDTILPYNSRHFVSFMVFDLTGKKAPKQEVAAAAATGELKPEPYVPKIAIVDVPDSYWASKAVQSIVQKKILSLYPDKRFRPEKPIIRADLATVLIRIKYGTAPKDAPVVAFSDIANNYWARNTIEKAAGLNLMKGYPDGTFKPSGNVSLLDGALACVRATGLSPKSSAPLPYSNIAPDHFAATQIRAARDAGLLDFVTGSTLPTERPLTRAELSWMVYKLNLK